MQKIMMKSKLFEKQKYPNGGLLVFGFDPWMNE